MNKEQTTKPTMDDKAKREAAIEQRAAELRKGSKYQQRFGGR